ncbi:MAG: cupin domain-containing protein [Stellaceae bacterium]
MAYVDPRLLGKPVPSVSAADMERERVARLDAVKGSDLAFLDQRIPGYRREIINMIGMGVTENVTDAALAPKIKGGAHGFTVTYVRNTPKSNGAALHRHPTEEVFIAAKGPWEVFWLEGDEERVITLQPGDLVNVPIGLYRGFRNASDDLDAVLIAVVGGPDPGKVDWHPSVIAEARKTGLAVDDDGKLIEVKNAAE